MQEGVELILKEMIQKFCVLHPFPQTFAFFKHKR